MLLETIIVTRLLGLVAGEYPVRVEAGSAVQSVKVERDGKTVATLAKPPWVARVDFGKDIEPHELTVIAYDGAGVELARDTQAINLARTNAEVGVLLDRGKRGVTAIVRPRHYASAKVSSLEVALDGTTVGRGETTVFLGALDPAGIHVVSVNASFADGSVAKKEVVFGGVFGEEVPSELTAIAVRQRKRGKPPVAPCFVSGDQVITPMAVEKNRATVFFVHSGLISETVRKELAPSHDYFVPYLLDQAELAIVSPRSRSVEVDDSYTHLFDGDIYHAPDGVLGIVMHHTRWDVNTHVADAVASAAFTALRRGRRAIVLIVRENATADRSTHKPQAVRRYLERVGIPFRVWAVSAITPELEAQWGKVEDISTREAFGHAIRRLRETLSEQRIAWVPLPAYAAFNLQAKKDCAYEPLAVLQPK
jgi:hypothetical protein